MRCLNCHTVMMDTDPICPSCKTPVDRATAAPPGLTGNKPNGLWMMLPIFGGALGGALYAGVMMAHSTTAPGARGHSPAARAMHGDSEPSNGWGAFKLAIGLLFLLGGAVFLLIGGWQTWNTWTVTRRVPKVVATADLVKKGYAESAPSWITFKFEESKPSGVTVTRKRLAHGGEVPARCILVRVEDKWLAATVAEGFEGSELVGRLVPGEAASVQTLMERVRKGDSGPVDLLPFEFNGVDGSASDQQARYIACGILDGGGIVGVVLGLLLFLSLRRSASSAQVASADWSYQSVPGR
jgi:hypothetical protein